MKLSTSLRLVATSLVLSGVSLVAASAQPAASPPANSITDQIIELVVSGPGDIDIPVNRRSDLSQCGGVSDADVVRAVNHCWPVLQQFRRLATLVELMIQWAGTGPEERKTAEGKARGVAATAAADAVIASADSLRQWPAADFPLAAAHLAKSVVEGELGNFDAALGHMDDFRSTITASKLENAEFKSGVELADQMNEDLRDERANPDP